MGRTQRGDHLTKIARAAARDAGVEDATLMAFLEAALHAGRTGRARLADRDLAAFRAAGELAAERGTSLPQILDLFLSATWRLWRYAATSAAPESLPALGEALLRAGDDVVAAIAAGYQDAQRRSIRQQESARREFVEDLLSGSAPDRLQERSAVFGFNALGPHRVFLVRAGRLLLEAGPVHAAVESTVLAAFGPHDVVVATKDGLLVCVVPGALDGGEAVLCGALASTRGLGSTPWQIGVGEEHAGPEGSRRSYLEAREALELAGALGLDVPVVRFADLLPYRLLTRDPDATRRLVDAVLGGLWKARGGPEPSLATLEAFFAEAGNVTATARRLFLSPRAVTYRLATIERLTGRRPQDPEDRFVLELAVRGHRLLGPSAEPSGV